MKTFLIKVKLLENYDYSDIEQILDNCSIVDDVDLIEEYDD